jgi:diguanylate cyclase (GGDEF)-like protein
MIMSEDDDGVATPQNNRWRPLLAGGVLFTTIFILNSLVIEDGLNIFGLARTVVIGGISAWVTLLLYKNNTLKRDGLTGLYRRLVVEEKLEKLRLAKKDVTIAMIDVNGLRGLNNSRGHEEGDKLLKEVAHRLNSRFSFRRVVIARLGGDEFIVVAEHKSQQELCDEITSCLAKEHCFGDWFIAAAGVARSRNGYVRDALRCADKAMYRAKTTKADHALQYDCVLDGIPPSTDLPTRPQKRLRDERFDN